MSRIGKNPVLIPNGVNVSLHGNLIEVKGPLGNLAFNVSSCIVIRQQDGMIILLPSDETSESKALWGMSRTLVNNLMIGVTVGFTRKLQLKGVGYKASSNKRFLCLTMGYSHDIYIDIPEGITVECLKQIQISVSGVNNEQVGDFCSVLKNIRKINVYDQKGIRIIEPVADYVRMKEGKKK